MKILIYPPPKQAKFLQTRLDISKRCYIKLVHHHSANFNSALQRFVAESKLNLELSYGPIEQEACLLTILQNKTKSKHNEHYVLTHSSAGMHLSAGTELGLYRGLMSLQQILRQAGTKIPYFKISDEPDFKHRGVMLDISRTKVPTLKTLKRLIDKFADLKYNQLQLYTEHTFAFSQHPVVWAEASPYTAMDMMEIHQYCQSRYIELVPNLNCFGHFERWLRHPEYKEYAECPDGFVHPVDNSQIPFGSTLKPNRKSLNLLNELYGEYLPLFESTQFNVGGDEPWELGKGWSAKRCDVQGTTQVYIDFMLKIKKLTEKHGKKMMFWSDIILKQPESLSTLSKDLTVMNWGYEGNHPFKRECEQIANQRIPYYVCPGTSSWNSLTGRTSNMTKNLSNAARNGLRFDAIGFLVTDWGDHGHHQYLPLSYPGFALGACESWNHKGSKSIDHTDLVNQIFFQEEGGLSAKLLLDLGRVTDLAQTDVPNGTIFNRLLFSSKNETRTFTEDNLDRCAGAFSDIQSQLGLIKSTGDERELLKGEINNAIGMASLGMSKLRKRRGQKIENKTLRQDLARIINNHQSLWLSRNRPGGLRESTERLSKLKFD